MSRASRQTADTIRELRGNALRLLGLLGDGRWHDQHECQEYGGFRYSARMLDLRKRGHEIQSRHEGRRWWFRLVVKAQLRLL